MPSKIDLDAIFIELDHWVNFMDTIGYIPADLEHTDPLQILPIFGMQQVRKEILEFCKFLCAQNWTNATVVEIGLGQFGSSHFLWRHIFQKVLTIECNHARVNTFAYNMQRFYKKHRLDDKRSLFVIGKSSDPRSVAKTYQRVKNIDLLFIDGDHSYNNCLTDWLLYSPLVRSGGIIAFHDSLQNTEDSGVSRLLKDISLGKFGHCPKITDIFHSKIVGISYYIVD